MGNGEWGMDERFEGSIYIVSSESMMYQRQWND